MRRSPITKTIFSGLTFGALLLCAMVSQSLAQTQTPAGTVISNAASAAYSDPSGKSYSSQSNAVTTTVAKVAGLVITPDLSPLAANPYSNVVPGEIRGGGIEFAFTNTGNFTTTITIPYNSFYVIGPGSIGQITTRPGYVSGNGYSGTINRGVFDVTMSLSPGQTGYVSADISIDPNAPVGSTIEFVCGDAATGGPNYDNQPADFSAREVRTLSTDAVNGQREARGSFRTTVESNAIIQLNLTAPSGPVAQGSDITYTYSASNSGQRPANIIALNSTTGSQAGVGVYLVIPVPLNTTLKSGQTFPTGTLYTTAPISTAPTQYGGGSNPNIWLQSPPGGSLASITRIAIPANGTSSLAPGATSASFSVTVTVNPGTNASIPIAAIADLFAQAYALPNLITDQSGDRVPNAGDGNANFNEGAQSGSIDGDGIIQYTTLRLTGSVLLGPNGHPSATGPSGSTNDDYSNLSVTTGIAGVAPGGVTTNTGIIIFTNTLQNTGNGNDTFTLTAPTVPTGFTVEISTNGGASYTTFSGGGSLTFALAYQASASVMVRITAPAGEPVFTGYDTVLRAASANTPASTNDTIDRLYTGFLRLDKTAAVINSTGIGGATDPVPGAMIEYAVTYTNISSSGGTGNLTLSASNLVITEDGSAAPNNWAGTTDQVVGSAADSLGGTITGDTNGPSLLKDTVGGPITPGASGTFRFKRRIR